MFNNSAKQIKEILGGDMYISLYTFMKNIATSNFDIKILMSRRCFVLYKIFYNIFKSEDCSFEENGIVISDKAINIYESDMGKSNICIYDDILIHGRSLNSMYKKLVHAGADQNAIHFSVFVFSDSKKVENPALFRKVDYRYLMFTKQWRNVSNMFIKIIQLSDIPYVSYAIPYYGENVSYDKKNSNFFETIIEENIIDDKHTITTSVIHFEDNSFKQFLDKNCLIYCIRHYIMKDTEFNTQKDIFVPLVCVKDYEFSKNEKVIKYNELEKCLYNDVAFAEEFITCMFSKIIMNMFCEAINCNNLLPDYFFVEKSIGIKNTEILKEAEIGTITDFINTFETITQEEQNNELLLYLYNLCKNAFSNSNSSNIKNVLNIYFRKIGLFDEQENEKLHENRFSGISLEQILNVFSKFSCDYFSVVNEIVKLCDLGIANIRAICCNNRFSTYLNSGEQSFRGVNYVCPDLIKYLYKLNNYLLLYRPDIDSEEKYEILEKFSKIICENKHIDYNLFNGDLKFLVFNDLLNLDLDDSIKDDDMMINELVYFMQKENLV